MDGNAATELMRRFRAHKASQSFQSPSTAASASHHSSQSPDTGPSQPAGTTVIVQAPPPTPPSRQPSSTSSKKRGRSGKSRSIGGPSAAVSEPMTPPISPQEKVQLAIEAQVEAEMEATYGAEKRAEEEAIRALEAEKAERAARLWKADTLRAVRERRTKEEGARLLELGERRRTLEQEVEELRGREEKNAGDEGGPSGVGQDVEPAPPAGEGRLGAMTEDEVSAQLDDELPGAEDEGIHGSHDAEEADNPQYQAMDELHEEVDELRDEVGVGGPADGEEEMDELHDEVEEEAGQLEDDDFELDPCRDGVNSEVKPEPTPSPNKKRRISESVSDSESERAWRATQREYGMPFRLSISP